MKTIVSSLTPPHYRVIRSGIYLTRVFSY